MAKMGRPTKYNEKIADIICGKLQTGLSLNKICKAKDMPCKATVHNWLLDKKEFLDKYARSRNIQIEVLLDEILDWCDIAIDEPAKAQAIKIKIDALKWYASKVIPKKYGDKIEHEHTGGVTIVFDKDDKKL